MERGEKQIRGKVKETGGKLERIIKERSSI